MSDLCAIPQCPNDPTMYHPERYVAFCNDHKSEILAYGIVGRDVRSVLDAAQAEAQDDLIEIHEKVRGPGFIGDRP